MRVLVTVPLLLGAKPSGITWREASGAWLDSLRRTIGPSAYPLPAPPTITER